MPARPNAPSPLGKRATKVEMAERVDAVAKLLLSGASRADIRKAGADPAGIFKLSPRQMDRLIDHALETLATEATQNRQAMIGTSYRRYNAIFSACMRVQDYERALKAQDRIVSLFALQAPPPVRTLNLNVDTAQLQALLDQIEHAGLSASDVFAAMIDELAQTDEYARLSHEELDRLAEGEDDETA